MMVSQKPSGAQGSRTLQVAIPGYIFSDDLRSWEQIADRAASIPIVVVNPRNGPNVYAGTRCDGFTPPNELGTGPNLSGLRMDDDFVSTKFPMTQNWAQAKPTTYRRWSSISFGVRRC